MNISLSFVRVLFVLICLLFFTSYAIASNGINFGAITIGLISGLLFGLLLIGFEAAFKRINLRSFNLVIVGLFCGYLMGEMLILLLQTAIDILPSSVSPDSLSLIKTITYLFCAYMGTTLAVRSADEFALSIPFVKFKATTQKKRDLIIDLSGLSDARIVDLAASGLLDNHLIIPRYIVKELNQQIESADENVKAKARRCLETLKKLESTPNLNLRYVDTEFAEIKDPVARLIQLARVQNASIITADLNRIQQSMTDGIKVINLHSLSNALKPITQNGELLNIKIQRYGKEPRQGVGYLDDGTMVVVNGGAEYIGDTIKAQVLSVKHTSSGRMIFCNTTDEMSSEDLFPLNEELDSANQKGYFQS